MHNASARRFAVCRAVLGLCMFMAALACHAGESDLLANSLEAAEQDREKSPLEKEMELAKMSQESTPAAVSDTPGIFLPEDEPVMKPEDAAVTAAVADGVTTILAVSAGGIEMNPLISASPAGVIAVTGVKYGLVKFAASLPEHERRTTLKTSAALWGGAAVNNMLIFLAAPQPLAIIAALITGFLTWGHMESRYKEEDQLIAARNSGRLSAKAEEGQSQQVESSGN